MKTISLFGSIMVGVAILLLMFCYRLWSLEISHSDDAVWFLAAHQGKWTVIQDFAVKQGRIWAFVSGSLLYFGLYLHGTFLGDLIRVCSFAVFFVLFYKIISIYFGKRLSILAATLNIALFSLRWEGSVITSYPVFFWVLGSVFLCSVWVGWSYIRNNRSTFLYASLGLFFISLFVHEGATVLFMILFMGSIVGNCFLLHPMMTPRLAFWAESSSRRLMLGAILICILYSAFYIVWRIYFPSSYEGNTLGSLNPERVLPVLTSLATNGSILSDIVSPYYVAFHDAVNQDGFKVTYTPASYLWSSVGGLQAWLNGLIVLMVTFFTLIPNEKRKVPKYRKLRAYTLVSLSVGFMIAVVPILPVSLVGKYQQHYYDLGVHAYAYTAFSHFGVMLSLASVIYWLSSMLDRGKVVQVVVSGFFAISISVLALCAYRMNDEIASDIAVEQSRWKAVDQAVKMITLLGSDIRAIYAPRLQSGSWFTVLETHYWAMYVATFHKMKFQFYFPPLLPSIRLVEGKLAYLDFMLGPDGRQLLVFMAPLSESGGNGEVTADRIMVSIENPSPSDLEQYILSFTDKNHGRVAIRFSQLDVVDKPKGTIRIINGSAVNPSTIRFERHSSARDDLLMECGNSIELGEKVLFGTSSLGLKGCNGEKMLQGGWHPKEKSGVWSQLDKASVTLPTVAFKHGNLSITFDIGTLVGLGFSGGEQHVYIEKAGKKLASRVDQKGVGSKPLTVTLPANEWRPGDDLSFVVGVDHTINPKKMGISSDTRNLGLHLYSIEAEIR